MSDYKTDRLRYDALREEFRASDGYRIRHDLIAIQVTYHAFETNFEELDCLIRLHYKLKSEGKLGDFYDREPLQNLLIEVTRRLHNFVIAAKSWTEHTQNFITRWYRRKAAINAEYDAEFASCFGSTGIGPFTADLRNYFAHSTSPFLVSRTAGSHPSPSEPLYSLGLNTADMNQQRKWSAGAMQYINTHKDDVDLGIYIEEYYELIVRFAHWLSERNEEWCKVAWEHTLSLQDQIQAQEREWGWPEQPQRRGIKW
jgi:hypothetical protein